MINFDVAVHNSNWPTVGALQECIDRRGWPVKLGGKGAQPLSNVPSTLGMPVVLKGVPLDLEASFVVLDSEQTIDINHKLMSIGADSIRFSEGDRIVTLTFRANIKEYQAGFYVMAALIKCFDGYGIHDRMHGTEDYADSLIARAAELEVAAEREAKEGAPIVIDRSLLDKLLGLSRKEK
jgi:hypothetical protein